MASYFSCSGVSYLFSLVEVQEDPWRRGGEKYVYILDRSVCGKCISINLFQTGLWSGLEFVLAQDRSITEWRLEP